MIPLEVAQGVWLGPEVQTPRDTEVKAQSSASIPLDIAAVRENTPDHIVFDKITAVTSTRSRFAQLGGEFPRVVNTQLGIYLSQPPIDTVRVPFINHAKAPILLEEGDVFRLMRRQGPPVINGELIDLIADEQIMLGGEEGDEWWIAKNAEGTPVGVGLYLETPEQWLPPREEPIVPKGATTQTFRDEMAKHLQPITPDDDARLRISQTLGTLLTTPEYMAFINFADYAVPPTNTQIANGQHINSPALYGGYPPEAWHIRTETRSTDAERNANGHPLPRKAIVVSFYPVLNPLPHTT